MSRLMVGLFEEKIRTDRFALGFRIVEEPRFDDGYFPFERETEM